jgi:hypothetical protein
VYLFPAGYGGRESNFKTASARLGLMFPADEKLQQFGGEINDESGH